MGSDMIQIVMKELHGDPVAIDVESTATIKTLKGLRPCVCANIRFKGEPLRNNDTLEGKGVRAGDMLHLFPQTKNARVMQITKHGGC